MTNSGINVQQIEVTNAEAAATDGAAHLARYWTVVDGEWVPQVAE